MSYKFLSLAILVLAPIIPMLFIISPVCPNSTVIVRRIAKWFAGIHFFYALLFMLSFNPNILSMSFNQEIILFKSGWIPTMGVSAAFGVDGLSILLCVLTTFIFLVALILSKYAITSKHKLYYSLILLLETSVLGIFCAKDIFFFLLFWMLETIPMYFLIILWGKDSSISQKIEKTGTKYLIYSLVGEMFLLFSILILYYYNFILTGNLTANINSLTFDIFLNPIWLQILVFSGFLIAFAIKMALFPFHNWYIDTQEAVPMPVNIILSSVILSMGAYGITRFNMQIFPTAFKEFTLPLMFLAIFSIIYFSMTAFAQNNIKRLSSYLNLALTGFIILGLTTVTNIGITGAILQIIACSLVFGAIYLITGVIYLRTKTFDIDELGGIARCMPKLMYFGIPICLAAAGMPLLIIFPALFMIISGMFTTDLLDSLEFQLGGIFVIFTLVLIAICVLRFLHKIFYGNILSQFKNIKDISMSEFFSLFMLIIPIILFGFAPMILINYYNNFVSIIMENLRF